MMEPSAADPQGKLVLVIDDDPNVLSVLEHIVQHEGFRVETAVQGEEGLEKILRLRPDLVVLDLMLPRYGGFELLRKLQGGPAPSPRIIVITGRYADRATAELIRKESNVVDFIEKPMRMAALAEAMHRALRTKAPAIRGAP